MNLHRSLLRRSKREPETTELWLNNLGIERTLPAIIPTSLSGLIVNTSTSTAKGQTRHYEESQLKTLHYNPAIGVAPFHGVLNWNLALNRS